MSIEIYESKNSEKVIRFCGLNINDLTEYCSKRYAEKIIAAKRNGNLWGCYLTKTGRIKATFI